MSIIDKYKYKTFIVKLQASLITSHAKPQALVYNENREIWFEGELSPQLAELLKGRPKAYFNCRLAGTMLHIDKEVETQNW